VIQQSITVILNGRPKTLAADTMLSALLGELGVDRRLIAVAHNGDVVPRDRYDSITLKEDDRIEVVRMVGGG
jgi:thiamine biosynthesis protein ThiS